MTYLKQYRLFMIVLRDCIEALSAAGLKYYFFYNIMGLKSIGA
jgi:hypothetical protein